MTRSCAVLAVGLGLWAAAVAWGDDHGVPAAPEASVAHPGAPCGPGGCGTCDGCGGHCRRGCFRQMLGWFTFCSRPVPPCCRTCCACRESCICYPQLYTFFLTGSSSCQHVGCHGGGCAAPGCHAGAVLPAGAIVPAPANGTGLGDVAPVSYSSGELSPWRPAGSELRRP